MNAQALLHRMAPLLLLVASCPLIAHAAAPRLAQPALRAAVTARLGATATVHWDAVRDAPRALLGLAVPTDGASPEARARNFLLAHGDLLGGVTPDSVRLSSVTRLGAERVVHFQQLASAIPVEDRAIAVQMDGQHRVRAVHSDFVPDCAPTLGPEISLADAAAAASARYDGAPTGAVTRLVLAPAPGHAIVAFRVAVARLPLIQHLYVYVRASDGQIVGARAAGKDMPPLEVRR